MSQACEHTWYTEGIIFNYIILGVTKKVERSSRSLRKLLKQKSAKFSYLVIIMLCFSYKLLLTFINGRVSYASASYVDIPLTIKFLLLYFSICNFNFYLMYLNIM